MGRLWIRGSGNKGGIPSSRLENPRKPKASTLLQHRNISPGNTEAVAQVLSGLTLGIPRVGD